MSDSNCTSKRIGFSTGALERGNYRAALDWLRENHIPNVELSALRLDELEPLIDDLNNLPLDQFSYVSFHAPSAFPQEAEPRVVELLKRVVARGWNAVVHPDVIRDPKLWESCGRQLLLENMDRRKPDARTADELAVWFEKLPEARLCLDVAHARQLDTTLTLLSEILDAFPDRLAQVHISELDSNCHHQPMSASAVKDYQALAGGWSADLPVIIESVLDGPRAGIRLHEARLAREATEVRSQEVEATTV
jgi:hypothetical protein